MMVPFYIPIIIRPLIFRVPKRTIILTTTHIGIMKKKMEATIIANQVEKKMENEMETGII